MAHFMLVEESFVDPQNSRRLQKTFSVYVIGLNRAVLSDRKFASENPQHKPEKPCVYVGMTGLTPEVRFFRHQIGIQACRLVRRYGENLKPRLYLRFNPMTFWRLKA